MRPPHKGPSLPQSLLDEIDSQEKSNNHRKKHNGNLSRKESRKLERQAQKQRKVEFYSHSHKHPQESQLHSSPTAHKHAAKRNAEREHEESPKRKKPKLEETKKEDPRAKPKSKTKLEKLTEKSLPSLPKSRQEEQEDAYIAYLESKLGWKKGGKKSNKYGAGLEDDGLDELLNDLDMIESSTFGSNKKTNMDSAFEDEDDEMEDDEDDLSEQSEEEEDEEEEEEWTGFSDEEAEVHEDEEGSSSSQAPQTAATRYIPPHLRNRAESTQDSEEQIKLTRQLKGLLNRMSEQNIASIIDSVEEVYRNSRRHDVTATLTTLIVDGISSHSILLDSYVVLYAAFVSALHKLIGIDFAAYFVQNVVESYEKHFQSILSELPSSASNEDEPLGKEPSNLLVLLSELYNFQVISCVLVFDLIRDLLEGDKIEELKVELLLKIVRNSGYQLRSDDPLALKDIIQIVQEKVVQSGQQNGLSSRTRFMIETLTNLKNNKSKRQANPGGDAVDRMKKFLGGLGKKRHVLAHEPLRVTLSDLRSADTKGKWWIVGAAWSGDPLVDRQRQQLQLTEETPNVDNKQDGNEKVGDDVLQKLAKKMGMNTSIRRSIFGVVMTSEDYMDACERLGQLRLTEIQQREIIRVLIHCCGNEKSYNPYYALLTQQLIRISQNQNHKFTLQYCLWDFIRGLGESTVGGAEVIKNMSEDNGGEFGGGKKKMSDRKLRNIAMAYGWWIAKDCCSPLVLKPIDFTIIKPQTRQFLTDLFISIYVSSQLSTPPLDLSPSSESFPKTKNRGTIEEIFIKATRVSSLAIGLVYWLGEMGKKFKEGEKEAPENGDEEGKKWLYWANAVALDTLRTGLDVVPNL